MDDLKGKAAVVTGAASGIGRGIARALAADGVDVVVADINGERAEAVAAELRASGVRSLSAVVDISDRGAVEALAEQAWNEFGSIDLLVANAGVIAPFRTVLNTEEGNARWVFDVNLFGTLACCQVFGRRFVEQGTPAWIMATASEHSVGVPNTGGGIYTASKHAVLGLMDVLRNEVPDHIGCSVLCPGMVATNLNESLSHRPERFGGPGKVGPAMNAGLDPDEVGRRAVDGLRRGDFYVFTHPPLREVVDERYAEVASAFDRHCPRFEGDEVLDTRAFLPMRQRSR